MHSSQRREALIAELNKRFDPFAGFRGGGTTMTWVNGAPRIVSLRPEDGLPRPDYSKYTYAQLIEEMKKHLPPGADAEQFIDDQITRNYLNWLEERHGKLAEYEARERVM